MTRKIISDIGIPLRSALEEHLSKCPRSQKKLFAGFEHMAEAMERSRLNVSDLECREIRNVNDNKQEHLRNNTGTEAQSDIRPCVSCQLACRMLTFCDGHTNIKSIDTTESGKLDLVTHIEARRAVFRWSASVVVAFCCSNCFLHPRCAQITPHSNATKPLCRCQGNRPTSANHNPSPSISPGNCCAPFHSI